MFSIDQKIADLKVRERTLYKVFFSMNIHPVAALEQGAEDARSYVFFFREGGKFLSYIGLYFIRSNRTVYYSHSSNPFPESELPDVEDEARGFAEELGAMLDELGLANMSDREKDTWIEEQDIFSARKKTEGMPEPKHEEQSTAGSITQPGTADASASVVQAAPSVEPAPPSVEAAVPAQPPSAQQPAPSRPAEMPSASATQFAPVTPAPVPDAKLQVQTPEAPRPQIKRTAVPPRTSVEKTAVREPALSSTNVLEQAVKAGVVKAPKLTAKKDVQSAAGIATREKEVLAHLLASF